MVLTHLCDYCLLRSFSRRLQLCKNCPLFKGHRQFNPVHTVELLEIFVSLIYSYFGSLSYKKVIFSQKLDIAKTGHYFCPKWLIQITNHSVVFISSILTLIWNETEIIKGCDITDAKINQIDWFQSNTKNIFISNKHYPRTFINKILSWISYCIKSTIEYFLLLTNQT